MIILGRIVAPFGVQGWVKVHPFGDDPLSWKKMPQWWLSPNDSTEPSGWKAYKLAGCRAHGKGWIAAFEGVADRNGAEALTRQYIAAPREAMPETDSNEYYWGDLIGLQVENEAGEPLGAVTSLLSAGAHDVLQITDGEDEHLVPFVAAYVLDVDLAAKRIRVVWQKDW